MDADVASAMGQFDKQQSNQATKKTELKWLHRFTREEMSICCVLSAKP
jgi:hypothetical protein